MEDKIYDKLIECGLDESDATYLTIAIMRIIVENSIKEHLNKIL